VKEAARRRLNEEFAVTDESDFARFHGREKRDRQFVERRRGRGSMKEMASLAALSIA
jgi:hypothetical protein